MKPISRPMLIRIRIILQHLANGQRVTAGQMAESLDVSTRTIARDFDYMMNGLELPISYEYKMKSYVLAGPLPSLFSLGGDGIATDGHLTKKLLTKKEKQVRRRRKSVSSDGAK